LRLRDADIFLGTSSYTPSQVSRAAAAPCQDSGGGTALRIWRGRENIGGKPYMKFEGMESRDEIVRAGFSMSSDKV
jgi:hypothetical protein